MFHFFILTVHFLQSYSCCYKSLLHIVTFGCDNCSMNGLYVTLEIVFQ